MTGAEPTCASRGDGPTTPVFWRHALRLGVGIALLTVLVLLGRELRFTDDLGRLFPAGGDLARAMDLLRTLRIADTLLVEVDGRAADREALLAATDALAERLAADPELGEVRWRIEAVDGRRLHAAVAPHAIDLLPEEALAERLSPAGATAALQAGLARLAGPGGAIFEAGLRADPLDLAGAALSGIRARTEMFRVRSEGGHLLDPEGRRALILVTPLASALTTGPDSPLYDRISADLSACPLPARCYGGLRIAVEAARNLRSDVQRAGLVGSGLLLLIVALGFRSGRAVLGAVGSLSLAMSASMAAGAQLSPLHGISAAYAAGLVGVAVDNWIHLYADASARGPQPCFGDRVRAADATLRELGPAFGMNALCAGTACVVLAFSRYPSVRDLGIMGVAAVCGSLAGTLLLGPLAYGVFGFRRRPIGEVHALPVWTRPLVLGLSVVALLLATRTAFDGDPRHLVPAAPETAAIEREFGARYGGFGTGGLAVFEELADPATGGMDGAEGRARDRADAVVAALAGMPGVAVLGSSALLPGPSTVQARRAAVLPPAELTALLDASGAAVGFRPGVFTGAAKGLAERAVSDGPGPTRATWEGTPFEDLTRRLVRDTEHGVTVIASLVLDDESQADSVAAVVRQADPRAELVMPAFVAREGMDDLLAEIRRFGAFALIGIALVATLVYRSPRRVLAACLPCGLGVVWTAAALVLTGTAWNAVSAAAMVLLVGLSLDYGVFQLDAVERGHAGPAGRGMLLNGLANMAGFGTLVLSRSPGLFGLGLAVLVGLGTSLLVTFSLVPALALGQPLLPSWIGRTLRRIGPAPRSPSNPTATRATRSSLGPRP